MNTTRLHQRLILDRIEYYKKAFDILSEYRVVELAQLYKKNPDAWERLCGLEDFESVAYIVANSEYVYVFDTISGDVISRYESIDDLMKSAFRAACED